MRSRGICLRMTDRRDEMIGKLLHHLIDAHNRIDAIREALVKGCVLSVDAIEREYRAISTDSERARDEEMLRQALRDLIGPAH